MMLSPVKIVIGVVAPVVAAAWLQAEALDISPLLTLLADAPILVVLVYLFLRQMKHHEDVTAKLLDVIKDQNDK